MQCLTEQVIEKYMRAAAACADMPLVLPGLSQNHNIWIRRYDLIDFSISGNKIFKLSGWLKRYHGHDCLISFGGAYSNHLIALAALANEAGIPAIGIIRGEYPTGGNPYLSFMVSKGMLCRHVSRSDYRLKTSPDFLKELKEAYPNPLIIPEGGAGTPGAEGARKMIRPNDWKYDWIVIPAATGTTAVGVWQAIKNFSNTRLLCFQVLKGENIIINQVLNAFHVRLAEEKQVYINDAFHFGGFAKQNKLLLSFRADIETLNNLKLDLVYGAKALYGLKSLILSGMIGLDEKVLYLHTGGIFPNQ